MLKNTANLNESRVPGSAGSLLVLVGFVLIGMAIGNLLAVWGLTVFTASGFENTAELINQLLTTPENIENGWYLMMLFQGVVHFFSYLLPSLMFWKFIENKTISEFNFRDNPSLYVLFLTLLLVVFFIPFNGKAIEWNAAMKFPEALSGIETWMRDKEDQMTNLTKFLTSYDQFGQLLIALVVVVLLPALGEEVLFRGVIQRKFSQNMNIHVAIWLAAAIFSAIHFQFYGFLPRMLLGALFGYLYYWTGNIWVAVLAHFVNNGFVLIMVFLYNIKVLDINIEETKTLPILTVLMSIVSSAYILYRIRQAQTNNSSVKS